MTLQTHTHPSSPHRQPIDGCVKHEHTIHEHTNISLLKATTHFSHTHTRALSHTHTHTHTKRLLSCLIIPRLEESKHIVLACTFFTAKNNNTLQRHVTLHVGEFTSACFHGDH